MSTRAQMHAADGAAAVGMLRAEVKSLIARAAAGEPIDPARTRIPAAIHALQSAAFQLDNDSDQLEESRRTMLHSSVSLPNLWSYPKPPSVPCASDVDEVDASDLLAYATSCLPKNASAAPALCLSLRPPQPGDSPGERQLELKVEGVFVAIICVVPSEVPGGDGWGSSAMVWLPTRVAFGSSDDPMPLGASQPPTLHVYRDLCARVGTVLADLGVLPAAQRLRPLLAWLASLRNLFESTCRACGKVFSPLAFLPNDILPPTARCDRLLPYHASCYLEYYGRFAEEAFLDAARAAAEKPSSESQEPADAADGDARG